MTLQQYRKDKGLTQDECSERLGITKEYLSMLENASRNPSDNLKEKLSELYEVSISEIFLACKETKCLVRGE